MLPATINNLPLELIIWILNAALDEAVNRPYYLHEQDYLSRLKDLARVCARWKSIIQSTPTFWTIIESIITPNEIAYMLRKSEKCNLAFKHDQFLLGSDFLGVVGSHMNRCSSLSAVVKSGSEMTLILGSPAPNLRRAIVCAAYCDLRQPVNLFNGQAEVLEELVLAKIPIRWDLGLPPTLRSLQFSLNAAVIERLPRPGLIISALSSCTGIEMLTLSCDGMFTGWGGPDWVDREVPPLELPKLRGLELENLTIGGSRYILGSLRAPALQNLELRERLHVTSVTTLLRPPNPLFLETIRRNLSSSKTCSITIESSTVALEILGEETGVILSLRCVDSGQFSLWLGEMLASQQASMPETRLRVSLPARGSELGFRKLVQALPNVVRLVFNTNNTEAVEILMQHLVTPYQADDGLRWHWAGLRDVNFNGVWKWPRSVLDFVRERYGRREQGDPSFGVPKWFPSPLTTLQVGRMKFEHPETFQEIKDIVGEEVLGEGSLDPRET